MKSIFSRENLWALLLCLILIALVKTEYDVTINAVDITKSKTVNDLYKIVTERVAS